MNWIAVTETENIPVREGRSVRIRGTDVAIFNLGDEFAAIDNSCPHEGGPMCDGIVSGKTVVCPLHGWRISLETGEVLKPAVCVRISTYPVRVEDGIVHIQIPLIKDKAA